MFLGTASSQLERNAEVVQQRLHVLQFHQSARGTPAIRVRAGVMGVVRYW